MPPLFSLAAENITPGLYPVFLAGLTVIMAVASELTHRVQVPHEAPEVCPENEG